MPHAEDPGFQLFSSLRYDPVLQHHPENAAVSPDPAKGSPLYMFNHHIDRVMEGAQNFKLDGAIKRLENRGKFENEVLSQVAKYQEENLNGEKKAMKVKIVLHYDGKLEVQCSPCAATPVNALYPTSLAPAPAIIDPATELTFPNDPWKFFIDEKRTPATAYTQFKTTQRKMYDCARSRAGIVGYAMPEEVFLQNQDGELTEGSLTSIYFMRDGEWVTPPVSSGGNQGTTRRWALAKKFCTEKVVSVDSLSDGEGCWMSNGVKGFVWGRVRLHGKQESSGHGHEDIHH